VTIIKPDQVDSTNALLFISAAGMAATRPKSADDILVQICRGDQISAGRIEDVPTSRCFRRRNRGAQGDFVIAYLDKFLQPGPPMPAAAND